MALIKFGIDFEILRELGFQKVALVQKPSSVWILQHDLVRGSTKIPDAVAKKICDQVGFLRRQSLLYAPRPKGAYIIIETSPWYPAHTLALLLKTWTLWLINEERPLREYGWADVRTIENQS